MDYILLQGPASSYATLPKLRYPPKLSVGGADRYLESPESRWEDDHPVRRH